MTDVPNSWGIFDEETAWFIYDFCKSDLTPWEMLLFYGYYVKGFTLKELGERMHCTLQAIDLRLIKINKKIRKAHLNKEQWRENRERKQRNQ